MRLPVTIALCLLFISSRGQNPAKTFPEAEDNWKQGKYIEALTGFKQVLNGRDGEAWLDRIALTTGELYQVNELSADGKLARFSPDGSYAIFEKIENGRDISVYYSIAGRKTGIIEGKNLLIGNGQLVFLRTIPTDSLTAAAKRRDEQLKTIGNDPTRRAQVNNAYNKLAAAQTFLFSYDLKKKKTVQLLPKGYLVSELVAGPGLNNLYLLALKEGNAYPAVYKLALEDRKVTELVTGKNFPGGLQVSPAGDKLLFEYLPRFAYAASDVKPERAEGTVLVDLADQSIKQFPGRIAAVNAAFTRFMYLVKDDAQNILAVTNTDNFKLEVVYTTDKLIADPVFSPDGSKAALAVKLLDDYEIFTVDLATKQATRITSEIQHDRLPVFIGNDRLMAAKGEPRHRRSYLYDLKTGESIKLFHNNTVRTLVPEYDWEPDVSGRYVLVTAERDGNTISPERGVYLADLGQKVTKTEVLARIEADIKAETDLRTRGEASYAKIAELVRSVTSQASVHRVYDYENSLFKFGSKHITQPGNNKAAEYLFDQYKSFGYEPQYQWFTPRASTAKTANVFAVLKGTVNPEIVYVVSSHYDSVVIGPGADDDASGTAALLEAARILADHPMPCTIIFASFTAEEAGLQGSREFVRQAQANHMQIAGALNNDMIGWANDSRLDNTIRYSNPGIRDIQHAAAFLFTNMVTYDVVYYKSTDAQSYYDAYGDIVGGIGSYPVLGSPYYHQWNDFLETINHQLVIEVAKTTAATLMLLASSPSRLKGVAAHKEEDGSYKVSWQASPEKDVTGYIVRYTDAKGKKEQVAVKGLSVTLNAAAAKSLVEVKAVNQREMQGWDWARVEL
ncbi:M20/M25/M40 family metallo-hydrolase [Hufsiella ginkgonis]|uniref:M20/M25/M40 family metallo-hydrolase n=1 Tax=Hufsiella ginkgonis TaxID=2695274 RepID=A0A7K1XWP8_9SPHI|nr:M20/M25/M40 family metallo-hydrolase [Hufsiella ginkgonis]MXV15405.1 M20/M25/M40 family metallo-hydrolase [Hufsiella ginkgonis]